MSQHKKILFLPRWYPNRYDPMPGLFIRRHAISVSGMFDVAVLYVHRNSEKQERKFEIDRNNGFGISEWSIYFRANACKVNGIASLINSFRFFRAHIIGFRLVRKEFGSPDLIHVNVLTRLGFVALFYKKLKKVPYVITEHWTRYLPGMNNFRGWWRKRITKVVVKQASAVMPVTLNLQHAMERHGLLNQHYTVIPNVVDTSLFTPDYSKKGKSAASILHVSCFDDRQKNISGILRVLKKLSGKRQDWHFLFVGEGIDFEKLVQYAGSLDFEDGLIEFAGLKENKELASIMQQADFQVMFSRYENLPVVIPESFACGVPFISSDVGGIAEHIHPGLGILVPSENEESLIRAIEYLLDHREEYSKEVIRQYAEDHFSREVIGRQIAAVYNSILGSIQR